MFKLTLCQTLTVNVMKSQFLDTLLVVTIHAISCGLLLKLGKEQAVVRVVDLASPLENSRLLLKRELKRQSMS